MMRVQNEIAAVVETDPAVLLRKYEKQIRELKQELVMHDALVERTGVVYDEHTPEQKHKLMQMVRQYVDALTADKEDEVLKLSSVHDIRELFRQFKILLKHAEAGAGHLDGGGHGGGSGSARSGSAGSMGSRSQTSNGSRSDIGGGLGDGNGGSGGHFDDVVGEDVPGAMGFGLGIVSGAARPSTVDANRRANAASGGGGGSAAAAANSADRGMNNRSPSPGRSTVDSALGLDEPNALGGSHTNSRSTLGVLPAVGATGSGGVEDQTVNADALRRQNEAFQVFKSTGAGRKLHQSLLEEKDKLFDARQRVKQVSNRVNAAKAQIDRSRAKLEDKRNQRSNSSSAAASPTRSRQQAPLLMADREEVVDEEEFLLMTAEREAKREYRSLFGDLKEARAELEFTSRSVELLRMRIVREFEDWFDSEGGRLAAAGIISGAVAPLPGTTAVSFSLSASGSSGMLSTFSRDDKLDDGEQFDQMEIDRVRAQDPDSLAFFQAQKKMRQQQTTSGAGGGGGSSPTSPGRLARRARRV